MRMLEQLKTDLAFELDKRFKGRAYDAYALAVYNTQDTEGMTFTKEDTEVLELIKAAHDYETYSRTRLEDAIKILEDINE